MISRVMNEDVVEIYEIIIRRQIYKMKNKTFS